MDCSGYRSRASYQNCACRISTPHSRLLSLRKSFARPCTKSPFNPTLSAVVVTHRMLRQTNVSCERSVAARSTMTTFHAFPLLRLPRSAVSSDRSLPAPLQTSLPGSGPVYYSLSINPFIFIRLRKFVVSKNNNHSIFSHFGTLESVKTGVACLNLLL